MPKNFKQNQTNSSQFCISHAQTFQRLLELVTQTSNLRHVISLNTKIVRVKKMHANVSKVLL